VFPEIGTVGPLTFHSFGLMVALALIAAGYFLSLDLRDRGMSANLAFELMLAGGIGGIVGARVYYVIERGGGDGLFSGAGLVWYGGLIGGFLAVVGLALVRRLPVGTVANLSAPALAIGYCIGRIGCQLAGDGDYGSASDLPWAMSYPDGTVPTTESVHPTPLYEALSQLVIFWLLWRLRARLAGGWALFGAYFVASGVMRFLVEFLRRNPEEAAGLTTAQLISLALVVIGAALVWTGRGRTPRPATA